MSEVLPAKSPTVIFKQLGEEAVLFCSRTEVYFGLNEVGILIWDTLPESDSDASRTFDELVDTMGAKYPDVGRPALEADVREFLEELKKSELTT